LAVQISKGRKIIKNFTAVAKAVKKIDLIVLAFLMFLFDKIYNFI